MLRRPTQFLDLQRHAASAVARSLTADWAPIAAGIRVADVTSELGLGAFLEAARRHSGSDLRAALHLWMRSARLHS